MAASARWCEDEGEGVLVLARNLPLFGNLFGGDAHAVAIAT
jgi:hypothetical protein